MRDNLFLAVRGVANGRYSFFRPRASHASQMATSELLERARLSHIADETVANLAHGQQRQLEIGMALAGAPRLILFDEPAAGLSPVERPLLTAMLLALPRSVTMILIEHDMDVALPVADQVTVMNEGAVVFEGSPQETASSPLVQSLYLGNIGRDDAVANPRA